MNNLFVTRGGRWLRNEEQQRQERNIVACSTSCLFLYKCPMLGITTSTYLISARAALESRNDESWKV